MSPIDSRRVLASLNQCAKRQRSLPTFSSCLSLGHHHTTHAHPPQPQTSNTLATMAPNVRVPSREHGRIWPRPKKGMPNTHTHMGVHAASGEASSCSSLRCCLGPPNLHPQGTVEPDPTSHAFYQQGVTQMRACGRECTAPRVCTERGVGGMGQPPVVGPRKPASTTSKPKSTCLLTPRPTTTPLPRRRTRRAWPP